jgi:hypothetical protein
LQELLKEEEDEEAETSSTESDEDMENNEEPTSECKSTDTEKNLTAKSSYRRRRYWKSNRLTSKNCPCPWKQRKRYFLFLKNWDYRYLNVTTTKGTPNNTLTE